MIYAWLLYDKEEIVESNCQELSSDSIEVQPECCCQ